MTLDVNEIVSRKIAELDENHVIEKAIEKKIETVVTQAIEDAFNWDFSRKISEKIKEQVGNIAESISLNSYNALVADTVKNIIEADMNRDLAEKVQAKIHELLLVTDKSVKLSDIVEKYKEVNFDDEDEYSFNVIESEREGYASSIFYKKLSFCDEDKDKEMWNIEFMRFSNDGDWKISSFKYEGETYFSHTGVSTLKHYDKFECLILRCMLNNLPVEIDYSARDCENELYHSNVD